MVDFAKLEKILKGEPGYRLAQIKEWIFKKNITNWNQALNLPEDLRKELKEKLPLEISAEMSKADQGSTEKALINLGDGNKVETVLMRHDNRNTVCVSSQVGCPIGCEFCATGKLGFTRNLTCSEILAQILLFSRMLAKDAQNVSNVVFMGMGEPMLNLDNILEAVGWINDKDSFGISSRKISISTVGLVDGIERLASFPKQVNLALSLHAADNKTRSKLIPMNKRYNIQDLVDALKEYIKKTNRKVMIEYLLLGGVNDSLEDAKKLAELLSGLRKQNIVINLIKYNQIKGDKFSPSTLLATNTFKRVLSDAGYSITERYRFGTDINAACGQLAGK